MCASTAFLAPSPPLRAPQSVLCVRRAPIKARAARQLVSTALLATYAWQDLRRLSLARAARVRILHVSRAPATSAAFRSASAAGKGASARWAATRKGSALLVRTMLPKHRRHAPTAQLAPSRLKPVRLRAVSAQQATTAGWERPLNCPALLARIRMPSASRMLAAARRAPPARRAQQARRLTRSVRQARTQTRWASRRARTARQAPSKLRLARRHAKRVRRATIAMKARQHHCRAQAVRIKMLRSQS